MSDFTLGVEEEFFLVDAETGELRPRIEQVLVQAHRAEGDDVHPELQRWQVETGTPVCSTLGEVRAELVRLRRALSAHAEGAGCRIVAASTHPIASQADQQITPKARYLRMEEAFGRLAREQLVSGCHVHVGIADRDVAVQAMNRARLWLSPLLALSASSPFWLGDDTGYASYRTLVWSRWPTAGPPAFFASRAEYDETVEALLASEVIPDLGMVYFDVRPSAHVETLEFRVPDVCTSVDDAVLTAGLIRALARTSVEAALRGDPLPTVRPELLRAAQWQAARSGLADRLVDLTSGRPVPAPDLVHALVDHVTPALEAHGDLDEVRTLVDQLLARGTSAARQRAAHERCGSLEDVVELLIRETVGG